MAASDLAVNDLIYVDGPVRAVVRRDGLHTRLYWLEGDLDLRRAELKSIADDRYQVIEALRGGNIALRSEETAAPHEFTAAVPGDKAPERTSLEKLYNDGRRINGTTTPERMKAGDILYTGKGAAVVIRRDGNDLIRSWLEGKVNLNQRGLQKDGPAKYKVTSDVVR